MLFTSSQREHALRRALNEYVSHYHAERNHQGKGNVLLFRRVTATRCVEPVQSRGRLPLDFTGMAGGFCDEGPGQQLPQP